MVNDAIERQPAFGSSGSQGASAAQIPQLPRPRMPRSQRAKIFIPFDPLKGYQDALREKELEVEMQHYELAGPDADFEGC